MRESPTKKSGFFNDLAVNPRSGFTPNLLIYNDKLGVDIKTDNLYILTISFRRENMTYRVFKGVELQEYAVKVVSAYSAAYNKHKKENLPYPSGYWDETLVNQYMRLTNLRILVGNPGPNEEIHFSIDDYLLIEEWAKRNEG